MMNNSEANHVVFGVWQCLLIGLLLASVLTGCQTLSEQNPLAPTAAEQRFLSPEQRTRVDRYEGFARKGMWYGLTGLAIGQLSDARKFTLGRTSGNVLLGAGATCWLGFLSLARAEYEDATALQKISCVGCLEPSEPSEPRGSRPERSSFTLVSWTLLSF